MVNKKALSESDICDRYVTPALDTAGWTTNQWRREYGFTDGKIIVVSPMAISTAATDVCAVLDSSPAELDMGIAVDIAVGMVIGSPCIANSPASVASAAAAYASHRSRGLRSILA